MRIVVAMSGGVDSSVVAGLLCEAGHEVIGVHMKLHEASTTAVPEGDKRCCGYDDALDARKVAERLGIPFYVMNLKEAFRKAVMDDLAKAYLEGRTPNPCVQCNGVLKFRVLLQRALALGADRLATGHYAQIIDDVMYKAVDENKDQTYFLYPIAKQALSKTLFPLGGMTKVEVRAHAERLGLETAKKPESQEICFVPDGDHAKFVHENYPAIDASGDIVDMQGRILGRHDAYYRFTVGQRRGLQVALGKPAYVVRIEPDTKRVVIGFDEDVHHGGVIVSGWNWFEAPTPDAVFSARIRHRGRLIPARVSGDIVSFLEPGRAASSGQAIVLYDGDRVVGGGTIARALPMASPTDHHEVAEAHP